MKSSKITKIAKVKNKNKKLEDDLKKKMAILTAMNIPKEDSIERSVCNELRMVSPSKLTLPALIL